MDYERYGRQIALAELGLEGQEKLASRAVRFSGDPSVVALAERIWTHAGGALASSGEAPLRDAVSIDVPSARTGDASAALAAASWATLDATRAILGWPARPLPPDLAALIGIDRSMEHTQS
ncbi:MAG: hypothetical protein JNK05_19505 [Myxococcales bacterium]|nr:hypothetical protein [Myxococcales bacterium]